MRENQKTNFNFLEIVIVCKYLHRLVVFCFDDETFRIVVSHSKGWNVYKKNPKNENSPQQPYEYNDNNMLTQQNLSNCYPFIISISFCRTLTLVGSLLRW